MLMNESGDVTSHLMGFFYRTIRMVDHGIKPCYIFDGKPPELKGGVVCSPLLLLTHLILGAHPSFAGRSGR
jgi:hypothetical protein